MNLHDAIQSRLSKMILAGEVEGCVCEQCQIDMIQLATAQLEPGQQDGQSHLRGDFQPEDQPCSVSDELIVAVLKGAVKTVSSSPHHD